MRIDPTRMPLRRPIAVRISRELRLDRPGRRNRVSLWDVLGLTTALALAIAGLNFMGSALEDPGAMLHASDR